MCVIKSCNRQPIAQKYFLGNKFNLRNDLRCINIVRGINFVIISASTVLRQHRKSGNIPAEKRHQKWELCYLLWFCFGSIKALLAHSALHVVFMKAGQVPSEPKTETSSQLTQKGQLEDGVCSLVGHFGPCCFHQPASIRPRHSMRMPRHRMCAQKVEQHAWPACLFFFLSGKGKVLVFFRV